MNLTGTIGGAKETLKHICAALSNEYKVPIELDDESEGAHTHGSNTKIVIGTKNLSVYGLDYHVGLVIHEIAHIRYSPPPPKNITKPEMMMLNMVEDERIEQLQKNEYAGADYYLQELHNPTYDFIEADLEKSLRMGSEKTILWQLLEEEYVRGELNSSDQEKIHAEIERRKSVLLKRIIGMAYLLKEGRARLLTTTGNLEADYLAHDVARLLKRATHAKRDDIPALAKRAHELLKDFIPKGSENQETHYSMMIKKQGGNDVGAEAAQRMTDGIYLQQDSEATASIERLKRKLLARMRENERQRYTHNKRKGVLNKRTIRKVALKNYRVYKKREEIKGQKYSVEIAIDTSGSMFSRSNRRKRGKTPLETAQYGAALLARTFRALGFETGVSMFGNHAETILHPKERYNAGRIQERIGNLDGHVYGGGTDILEAIKHSLKLLKLGRSDTKKILVLMTDGSINHVDECRTMLTKAERQGISTLIFYIDLPEQYARRIFKDAHKERFLKSDTELIPACVELAKELVV